MEIYLKKPLQFVPVLHTQLSHVPCYYTWILIAFRGIPVIICSKFQNSIYSLRLDETFFLISHTDERAKLGHTTCKFSAEATVPLQPARGVCCWNQWEFLPPTSIGEETTVQSTLLFTSNGNVTAVPFRKETKWREIKEETPVSCSLVADSSSRSAYCTLHRLHSAAWFSIICLFVISYWAHKERFYLTALEKKATRDWRDQVAFHL